MIAIKTADLTQNFKHIADIIMRGEKILVSRPQNENLVILTEKEYNEMEKLRQSATRHQKIAAVKKILSDVTAMKNEDHVLTDSDWDELADIRSQTNLARNIEV